MVRNYISDHLSREHNRGTPYCLALYLCIKWTCSDNVQQHIVRWTVKAAAVAHHSKGIYADNADAQQ